MELEGTYPVLGLGGLPVRMRDLELVTISEGTLTAKGGKVGPPLSTPGGNFHCLVLIKLLINY